MSIVDKARELAYRAHAGQVDKAGRLYIEHVARVAAAVSDDREAEAVAWLHDVLEDQPEFGDEVFYFPHEIALAASLLSRNWSDGPGYYSGVRSNPLARRVKLADIADNSDEARLALLDAKTADRLRRKYANALKALGVQP